MITARSLMGVGRLGFVLGSLSACSNGIQSLGEDSTLGSAGTRASTWKGTGGLATGGTATSATSTGGNSATSLVPMTSAVGGNTPINQTTSFGGGEPVFPAGGSTGYGGSSAIANAGSGGSDPSCNDSNACLPRCDASGRCALWQTDRRAVVDLIADGSALYFVTAATTSAVGLMSSPGSLYRAERTSPVPTMLTSLYEIPVAILGRFAGATYLHTSDRKGALLVRISDSGSMGSISSYGALAMQGSRVIAAASDGLSLTLFELGADPYFGRSATLPTQDSSSQGTPARHVLQPYVFEELVGFTSDNPDSWCWISPAAPGAVSCVGDETMPGRVLANSAQQVFVASSTAPNNALSLTAYDATGQQPHVLYTGTTPQEYVVQARYAAGWLYALLVVGESQARVVRFATSVSRPPQEVIPSEIVTPAFMPPGASTQFNFAVGPSGIYWTAAQVDITQSQYIYHAPLPPQPCDSELCADPKQVCVNGFCHEQ